jgi:hypothetical protein
MKTKEPLDHPEWYPPDWDTAPPCVCGHGKCMHLPSPQSRDKNRIDCLYEADKPPDARCRSYRLSETLPLW